MQTIKYDREQGVRIEYDTFGKGHDVLLLVHGHPFNRTMWRPQVEGLANSIWRIIAPDLRGYGESSVVEEKTTFDIFAADLADLLDRLAISRVVIGGLSMGGQIAMEFCRLYPNRVRGVILAATSPIAETSEGKVARQRMAERLLKEGMDRYADEVLPKMLAESTIQSRPEVAGHVRQMMRATNPKGAASAVLGRAERPDYVSTLANLDIPALVYFGENDFFMTRADAHLLHTTLRGSQLITIPQVGHMPNLENPSVFNAALGDFLASIPPEARSR